MGQRNSEYNYAGQILLELGLKSDDNGQWASGVALDNISLGVTPSWISTNANGYMNYMDSENLNFQWSYIRRYGTRNLS